MSHNQRKFNKTMDREMRDVFSTATTYGSSANSEGQRLHIGPHER